MPNIATPTIINDPDSDSIYLMFSDSAISHSVELGEDVIVDVDQHGMVVGIDIQYVTANQFGFAQSAGRSVVSATVERGAVAVSGAVPAGSGQRLVLQPA